MVQGTRGYTGDVRTTMILKEGMRSRRCVRTLRTICSRAGADVGSARLTSRCPLEVDVEDMKVISGAVDRYSLMVLYRSTEVKVALPILSKASESVLQHLWRLLCMTFGVPLSIQGDPGGCVVR